MDGFNKRKRPEGDEIVRPMARPVQQSQPHVTTQRRPEMTASVTEAKAEASPSSEFKPESVPKDEKPKSRKLIYGLVVAGVICLLVTAGLLVNRAMNKKEAAVVVPVDTTKYLNIPELGIRMVAADYVSDASYQIRTDGKETYASLTTWRLASLGPRCTSEGPGFARIRLITPPSTAAPTDVTAAAEPVAPVAPEGQKSFDIAGKKYFIELPKPNDPPCYDKKKDTPETQELVGNIIKSFEAAELKAL